MSNKRVERMQYLLFSCEKLKKMYNWNTKKVWEYVADTTEFLDFMRAIGIDSSKKVDVGRPKVVAAAIKNWNIRNNIEKYINKICIATQMGMFCIYYVFMFCLSDICI